jgi:DNA-binding NarL/FixJ family response regulator
VKKHLQHIFPKLGVETCTAAALAYLRESVAVV